MSTVFLYIRGKIYAASLIIVTLLAFPLYVPRQTWREARQLTSTGRIHWSIGAFSIVTSTVASLAIALCGLFFVAVIAGLGLIAIGYSG